MITKEHQSVVNDIKNLMAAYKGSEDLIQIGAYNAGSNARVDNAIKIYEPLMKFLRQDREKKVDFEESLKGLVTIKNILTEINE